MTLTDDLKWVKSHVILLLAVVLLVAICVFGIEDVLAKHDKERAAELTQILAAQSAQTQLITSKLTQDEQNWNVQNAQSQQLIATLAKTIAQREVAAQKQQQIDATLSAQAAADRLALQTLAAAGQVIAQGDSVLMDLPVSREVVQLLDTVPVLQADLADTQKQLGAETVVATNLQANVDGQKSLITSLQAQNADQVKACDAQIKVVKAEARKGKLKYLGVGVVIGFGLRLLLGGA